MNTQCVTQLVESPVLTGLRAITVANLLMRGLDPRSVRKLESELEKENRVLREQLAERDAKIATLMELWKLRA